MVVQINRERALELIDKTAKAIASRRMASPAILAIESLRPLNFLGSQIMYFFAPFAQIIFNKKEYEEFAAMIENDEYVLLLLKRIDELDIEYFAEERKQAKLKRQKKWNNLKNSIKKVFIKRYGELL
jgi:hypothetical protein